MKTPLLLLLAVALSGCANVKLEWAASYASDNVLADRQQAMCAKEP